MRSIGGQLGAALTASLVTLGACGGGSSGTSGTFNCMSKCPNDTTAFSQATLCQATLNGPCSDLFAAYLMCLHDNEVCDSAGMSDQVRTMMACTIEYGMFNDCTDCLSGSTCPSDAAVAHEVYAQTPLPVPMDAAGDGFTAIPGDVAIVSALNGYCSQDPALFNGKKFQGTSCSAALECSPVCCHCAVGMKMWLGAACLASQCADTQHVCVQSQPAEYCTADGG